MAIIDTNQNPSKRDLTWFGLILLAFAGLVGALVLWRTQSLLVTLIIWVLGVILMLAYYAVRPLRRPLYRGWMSVVSPMGWIMSNVLLGAVFYLVLMPIGLLMRWCGYDPMRQHFEPGTASYWVRYSPHRDMTRYFRQF